MLQQIPSKRPNLNAAPQPRLVTKLQVCDNAIKQQPASQRGINPSADNRPLTPVARGADAYPPPNLGAGMGDPWQAVADLAAAGLGNVPRTKLYR